MKAHINTISGREVNYRRIVETSEEGIWVSDPHGMTIYANQKMADMLGYTQDEMIGKPSLTFMEIGAQDIFKSGGVLKDGTSIQREYKITGKDGKIVWTHVSVSPLFDDEDKYLGNLWMHTDITERKLLEEALTKIKSDLELKVQERTSKLLSTNLKLRRSEQHIQDLFDVMAEGVVYLTAKGRISELNPAAAKILGIDFKLKKNYRYQKGKWPLVTPELATLRTDGTIMPPEERTVVRAFTEKRPIKNVEMGILRSDGSLVWLNTNAVPVISPHGKFLGVVGTFIDITEQKTLRDEKEQFTKRLLKVQEEERKRISRELHDDTAQYLALLTLEMDALLEKEKQLPQESVLRLQKLRSTAEKALQEVRRFSHELRPSVLEHFGLAAALELIIGEFNSLDGVKVNFSVEGEEVRLEDEVELALFRIVQESINNTRKHAQASTASVTISYTPKCIQLSITDDGIGFDILSKKPSPSKGGLGLVGMRERAQLIGASLKIKSQPGAGTIITVEVPLH